MTSIKKKETSTKHILHRVQAIFCDNCSSLALAQLNKKNLCDQCLIDIIKVGGRKNIEKISPLCLSSLSEQHRLMLRKIGLSAIVIPHNVKVYPLGIAEETHNP